VLRNGKESKDDKNLPEYGDSRHEEPYKWNQSWAGACHTVIKNDEGARI